MIKIIDRRSKVSTARSGNIPSRENPDVERTVSSILRSVQKNGDAAVKLYTRKFDGAQLRTLKVPVSEIRAALRKGDAKFLEILRQAARNIRRYHSHQIRKNWKIQGSEGSELRQISVPVDRVGVYVPGGKAAYPSTVLMNVIPAQVAGVKEIHLVSPPNKNGDVHPDVLIAAGLLGIDNVYSVGGAQAIAALAYGTETIPAVDKIVGPGNIFVATAKRMVYGTVGIDSIAGPSEVVILADNSARPAYIAADLLAQAEHDERAVPILITTSRKLAESVRSEMNRMTEMLERKEIITAAIRNRGRIYIVPSLEAGIALVNDLAPEHLEIMTTKDEQVLKKIRHAGSIFLGDYSPVAVGDYYAGPNHVLPTERTARFSSPLSVDDFLKRSSVVRYTQKGIDAIAENAATFADHEGLSAHAHSLRIRTRR
ncbi:MAG: histidinol dehydrogenase [Bacteroidota bacterium]